MTASFFISITCLTALLFYIGIGRQNLILGIYLGWCSVIAALSYLGFFKDSASYPPRMLMVLLPAIIFVLYSRKKFSRYQLNNTSLIAIHVLRLPVELVLYQLFLDHLVPEAMTFQGWNFDILSGISALIFLVAKLLKYSIPILVFRTWNFAGLIMLFIIITIAVLSAPSPFQLFSVEQPNVAILQFPYTLLPALVVPIVLLSHLLLLKQSAKQE
jgi:hypothetical protein